MDDVPEVLFVCTHNAGRCQMAAALLNQQAAGRVRVTSAGSQPANELNPAGLTVEQIRPIRDEISARVRALISELAP